MILTLTVNPAIDHTVTTDRISYEDRVYVRSSFEQAGGKGINAAWVIHGLGGPVLALATCGGHTGRQFTGLLEASKLPVRLIPIRNEIRRNLTISDLHGLTIKLDEAGPQISRDEEQTIEAAVRREIEGASWLLLCGSLPPGMSVDFYARLIQMARERNVRTLLDTGGEALRVGLEARPTMVKPNRPEAERLLDRSLLTRQQSMEAVQEIARMGAETVVLSLGSEGAMGVSSNGSYHARAPEIRQACPIGAGDALAATCVWALSQNQSFQEALRWGVAAGTAAAATPGTSFASLSETQQMREQVRVEAL
ncbi:MAG: 1-phosphofructokinase family hexose kinase [Acidobacteria bacterium]|nr:1-phosphofructokinase family hexose kinase [Acidobacteriota bacterium]